MARVRIPRTSTSRRDRGYARLVRCVEEFETPLAFTGKLFRPGDEIEESLLRPNESWPRDPLLVEYAGPDYAAPLERLASGFGHRRRPDIHVLWRYEREAGHWRQLAHTSGVDNDWILHFAAIVRAEVARSGYRTTSATVDNAAEACARWIDSLDRELAELDRDERALAIGYFYEEVTARVAAAL